MFKKSGVGKRSKGEQEFIDLIEGGTPDHVKDQVAFLDTSGAEDYGSKPREFLVTVPELCIVPSLGEVCGDSSLLRRLLRTTIVLPECRVFVVT